MPIPELRLSVADDESFLLELFALTLGRDLAPPGLQQSAQDPLVQMQHRLRQQQYEESYPQRKVEIISVQGETVGRLDSSNDVTSLVLIDIAILPARQGQGIGGQIIQTLMDRANALNTAVSLHVMLHNPALRLYERLGFRITAQDAMYAEMRWMPSALS